ncbi:E3 ubiquitin-protein ligase listerin-like [Tubulanus polymorphus]|uniref:E3 ubiquitin-protein ligase listerin-like n=1 Tax=Tubulanus polymorphus TaxID=672921 RepID=UPI003DA4970F
MPGAKQKQANRTKGNVRPSSSGRAVDMLSAATGGKMGFIGFDSMNDLGYVPAAVGNDEADSSVDPEFRMVLRKFSKKDATTKLKTVQEFACLCKEKGQEAVVAVLPYWPRLYNKLSTDNDRRVREATQLAFEQLILRVKRNLAPQLKPLMGCWLLAQCDAHAPAASAAVAAFDAAFPPNKQSEAVIFCKNEVLSYIKDNLLSQTPQTLSDPSSMSKEESESRFEKFITSSLFALRKVLLMMKESGQTDVVSMVEGIVDNGKFWKYGKSQSSQIRSAFYAVLSALCQTNPELSVKYGKELSTLTLHNLDEVDPCVCGQLWDAILHIVSTIPDCWQYLNMRKAVLPKLWKLLHCGGAGNATAIYPNLLPLLSKIPDDTTNEGFYAKFFNNMKAGLSERKVQQSSSECGAVVSAFMECLRYALMKSFNRNSENETFHEFLLSDQLIAIIQAAITENESSLVNSPLFRELTSFLVFLHKANENRYEKIYRIFWKYFSEICILTLDSCGVDGKRNYIIHRLALLIEALHSPIQYVGKTSTRVCFTDGKSPTRMVSAKAKLPNVATIDTSVLLDPAGNCVNLVSNLCHKSFSIAREHKSHPHIRFLSTVLARYKMQCLFMNVLDQFGESQQPDVHVTRAFMRDIVLPWIHEFENADNANDDDDDSDENDEVLPALIDLLFSTYEAAPLDIRYDLLALISKSITTAKVMSCFMRTLVDLKSDDGIRRWLKSLEFGKKLITFTNDLCEQSLRPEDEQTNDLTERWLLLSMALSTADNFEPLLNKDAVNEILLSLKNTLPQGAAGQISSEHGSRCISFICNLADSFFSNVKGCLLMAPAEDLLFTIFQLSFDSNASYMLEKLSKTWQCGVQALTGQQGGYMKDGGFFYKAASFLKSQVVECRHIESLNRLTSQSVMLLKAMIPSGDSLQSTTCQEFAKHLNVEGVTALRTEDWFVTPLLEGTLIFLDQPVISQPVQTDLIPNGIASTLYMGALLIEMKKSGNETDEDSMVIDVCNVVVDAVDAISYCQSLAGRRKEALKNTQMGKSSSLLLSNTKQLWLHLTTEERLNVVERVLNKCSVEGDLCSLSLLVLLRDILSHNEVPDLLEMVGSYERMSEMSLPLLHTLVTILPYLSNDKLDIMINILTAQLISIPVDGDEISDNFLFLLASLVKGLTVQDVANVNADVIVGVLDFLIHWKDSRETRMCFSSLLSDFSWKEVIANVEMMKFMTVVMQKYFENITREHWDFILCCLVSWIQSCHISAESIATILKNDLFAIHNCHLLQAVASLIPNLEGHDLTTEWNEFFAEGIFSALFPLFTQIMGLVDQPSMTLDQEYLLVAMGAALVHCPKSLVLNHQLPPKLMADDATSLPIETQTLMNHLCPMLFSNTRAVQFTAYHLLVRFVGELSIHDSQNQSENDTKNESTTTKDEIVSLSPPVGLMKILQTSTEGVQLLTSEYSLGETLDIEGFTVEHTVCMTYLLCWKLILRFFRGATSELRVQYASYLKETGSVETLLPHLFNLMPETPLVVMKDSLTSHNSVQCLSSTKNLFSEKPALKVCAFPSTQEVYHLACSVYYNALKDLPAIVRQWSNDLDKRKAGIVDKFTTKYVSPVLSTEEIQSISEKDKEMDNMVVKARPAAREVVATYTVDDVSMELVVQLPVNYPLGVVTVESGKRVRVAKEQWRNWMLQMTTFLNHQNGSIIDGLLLWKSNIDKRFEGVEDCMICYSVIHGATCQLPKLQCKTCKKKYHSACLYKWFNTSNKSSCPLCRNLF